jgi:MscS family membrane protein
MNTKLGIKELCLIGAILLLAWVLIRIKATLLKKMAEHSRTSKITIEVIGKIFTVIIFFLSLLMVLQIVGLDIAPLLTFGGIGAAILGFASKDIFANFFGGVLIYATRPFKVDDFIEIRSKNIAGTVEEIGWYLTTIRDVHKKVQHIPNSLFSTEMVINDSKMTHRRIDEQMRFKEKTPEQVAKFIEKAQHFLKTHPDIDQNEEVSVFLTSISPYGIVLDIKAYTKTTNTLKFLAVKQEILLKIFELAGQSDI